MTEPVLEIVDLAVAAGERPVLAGVALRILEGEVHVLLGPNGCGKTTLLMAVMGMPGYRVLEGRILFRGRDLAGLGPDERARLGIALSFQRPPPVRGVRTRTLVEAVLRDRATGPETVRELAEEVRCGDLLDRDLNVGLSGGEAKRSELLQLLAMRPCLALFDEPESGVDLDSIAVVGSGMRRLLSGEAGSAAALIVTHTGHILREVGADAGHVLLRGRIVCRGDPPALFEDVRAHGYEGCLSCARCRAGPAELRHGGGGVAS